MNQVSPNSGVILADRMAPPEVAISDEDRDALKRAVEALEASSFAARLSAVAGSPIELLGQALPQAVSETASRATQVALRRALGYALKTIPKERAEPEARLHRALAALSGAMVGALGISAVLVELPISTTIMLRAIARISQSEGEDLSDPETALACLQVFALGGRSSSQHLHESGYLAVRAAMAKSLTPGVAPSGSTGRNRRKRLGACSALDPDRIPVWGCGVAEGCSTSCAGARGPRWSSRQLPFRGAFSIAGYRSVHRTPFGADLRKGDCAFGIRSDPSQQISRSC